MKQRIAISSLLDNLNGTVLREMSLKVVRMAYDQEVKDSNSYLCLSAVRP